MTCPYIEISSQIQITLIRSKNFQQVVIDVVAGSHYRLAATPCCLRHNLAGTRSMVLSHFIQIGIKQGS